MITYLYWISIIALAAGLLYVIGFKMEEWKIATIAAITVMSIGFCCVSFSFSADFCQTLWRGDDGKRP